jgi:putative endonuclease
VRERSVEERRRAEALGLSAETVAVWFLRLKGHAILDRRFRSHRGEIDIVARRGRTLIFVEVKARATAEAALDAVTPRSRARILAAADLWVARRPRYADFDRRFDVVLVMPRRLPRHLRDAFRGDDPDLPTHRRS